jgi:rubrerythrin
MRSEENSRLPVDLPTTCDNLQLRRVVSASVRARSDGNVPLVQSTERALWPAEYFGLHRVSIFANASQYEQQAILVNCAQGLLGEAYFIEKSGMYYAAKMSLLADSNDERMLYSMFAADEAIHFSWISPYVSEHEVARSDASAFIRQLRDVIASSDKLALAYIIQVVLEGWGLRHYRALSKDCLDAPLQSILTQVIKDEARHHASGLMLVDQQALSESQFNQTVEVLSQFCLAVQVGPQMLVQALERVMGHLSLAQKAQMFAELGAEQESAHKLQVLRNLIHLANLGGRLVEALDQKASLRPFGAQECARAALS